MVRLSAPSSVSFMLAFQMRRCPWMPLCAPRWQSGQSGIEVNHPLLDLVNLARAG